VALTDHYPYTTFVSWLLVGQITGEDQLESAVRSSSPADGNDFSICLYQQAVQRLSRGRLHHPAAAERSIQLAVGVEPRQAKWDPAHQDLPIRLETECQRRVHVNAGEPEDRRTEGMIDDAGFAETKNLVIGVLTTGANQPALDKVAARLKEDRVSERLPRPAGGHHSIRCHRRLQHSGGAELYYSGKVPQGQVGTIGEERETCLRTHDSGRHRETALPNVVSRLPSEL